MKRISLIGIMILSLFYINAGWTRETADPQEKQISGQETKEMKTLEEQMLEPQTGMAPEQEKQMIQQRIERLDDKISQLQERTGELEEENALMLEQNLQNAKQETQQQLQTVRETADDAWSSSKQTVQDAVDNIEQTYVQAKHNFHEWKTRQEFEDLKQKTNELQQQISQADPSVSDQFNQDLKELQNQTSRIQSALDDLKNVKSEDWLQAQADINQDIQDLRADHEFLERQLFVSTKQQQLDDLKSQLDSYQQSVPSTSEAQQRALENASRLGQEIDDVEDKVMDAALDKPEDWQQFKDEINQSVQQIESSMPS